MYRQFSFWPITMHWCETWPIKPHPSKRDMNLTEWSRCSVKTAHTRTSLSKTKLSTKVHGGSQLKCLRPVFSGGALPNPSPSLSLFQVYTCPLVLQKPIPSHLILGFQRIESAMPDSSATKSRGFNPRITSRPAEGVLFLTGEVKQAANLLSCLNLSRVILFNSRWPQTRKP